jgi:hypothetical protein
MRIAVGVAVLVVAVALGVYLAADSDDSDTSSSEPSGLVCPPGSSDGLDTEELVGLELSEAESLAQENGCEVRVVERDGEPLPTTLDLIENRINVAVEDGEVVRIDGLG